MQISTGITNNEKIITKLLRQLLQITTTYCYKLRQLYDGTI